MIHLKWLQKKLSRTYSKWLLTKEGDELVYNGQKFVKKINNYGAVEKSLLSKIVKNQRKVMMLTEIFKHMLWAYFLDYQGNVYAPLD
jgi:hypothetical protein